MFTKDTVHQLEKAIVIYMQQHPDDYISMPVLSLRLPVPESRVHGRQHYISQAIVQLRRRGLLQDVDDRCEHCGRAARTPSEVELHLTEEGRSVQIEDGLPEYNELFERRLTQAALRRVERELEGLRRQMAEKNGNG